MANKAISTLTVGSSVYLNVGGVRKEFLVVHQGLPSSLYDASCDGTWLLMKDCYERRQWNSSDENKYESSTINSYLNSTFIGLFDSAVQGIIKQVKIPYRKGGGSGGTNQSGANGLSAKIFLLSGYEIGWTTDIDPYIPVDGVKLAYFESGTSMSAQNKRIAYLNGSATDWWPRSMNGYNATSVWFVDSAGGFGIRGASTSIGIRPALILPSTTLVDDSGNVVTVDLTAHKTLINGTAYTVKGGKCMVNGTVYNILKGRTLIDGTGWDITFPAPLVMPVKGDLITMNLDGTDRQYRVLKVVDETTVEVLGMWNLSTSIAFGSSNAYSNSALDRYLNTTWYNTLSIAAKAAIVPKTITQDSWFFGTSGSPQYSGTYGTTSPGTFSYTISLYSQENLSVGNRYVYAMSVQDVLDYLSDTNVLVDTSGMLRNRNIWKMFWNKTSTGNGDIWLRSKDADSQTRTCIIDAGYGSISSWAISKTAAARPAFQIDLSKIDFTIGGAA